MSKIQLIYLPRNMWFIRKDGKDGPKTCYEHAAFWPNDLQPKIVAFSAYYSQTGEKVFNLDLIPTNVEYIDNTLGDNKNFLHEKDLKGNYL